MNKNPNKELDLLKGKVNFLSGALRLGHEAFQKSSLELLASHIVNNSRLVSPFDRSSLVDMRSEKIKIISVTGQTELNRNSEFCVNLKKLLQPFHKLNKPLLLKDSIPEEFNAAKSSHESFREYFKSEEKKEILLIPLQCPSSAGGNAGELFIWVLEFFNGTDKNSENLALLLSQHYNEALWFHLKARHSSFSAVFSGNIFSPVKVFLIIVALFLLSLVFSRVSQSVVADFEIVPEKENIQYAPFSGIIKESHFELGDEVKKGDKVLEYNTEEMLFDFSEARKNFDEISTELDLVRQKSFNDNRELGKVKLLALKKEKEKINIDRINWYLSKSNVLSDNKGIIVIDDKEKISGKAVRAGEKLFEILSPEKLEAEVMLNENDASVLGKNTQITLYLHTRPESPIEAKIESISPKPVLTQNRQFCYIIKVAFKTEQKNLICGMRGVARIKGPKVSLGYYLFRKLVLWWRKV